MPLSPEKVESRREFFRAAARYGLLALAAVGAAFASRNRNPAAAQTCVNRSICSGCGVFASCGLPAALSAKRAKGEPT
jgi:hypothetical protein